MTKAKTDTETRADYLRRECRSAASVICSATEELNKMGNAKFPNEWLVETFEGTDIGAAVTFLDTQLHKSQEDQREKYLDDLKRDLRRLEKLLSIAEAWQEGAKAVLATQRPQPRTLRELWG